MDQVPRRRHEGGQQKNDVKRSNRSEMEIVALRFQREDGRADSHDEIEEERSG